MNAGTTPATPAALERARRRRPGTLARRLPVVLAAAVVALQVVYPLVPQGTARDQLTVATVVVFFAASVTHAAAWRGIRFTAVLLVITAGGGFAVEALGVATGLPFGAYTYADSLGPLVAGVPAIIPLAWTMMAYPAYAVARRLTTSAAANTVVGGWALTSWDLFLDPQMVDAGHWRWEAAGPAILGIPLSNFAGWFLVATAMMALLHVAARAPIPRGRSGDYDVEPGDAPLYGLYLWVYASSLLGHLAFFGLPGSAALGGLGMGAVAVPLTLRLYRAHRRAGASR